jgi:hypothetical protein
MRKTKARLSFAVCVNNRGYPASLEVGKLYRIVPDRQAEAHGYVRVVDESGEDYAYSSGRFFPVEIPTRLGKVLRGASEKGKPRRTAARVGASNGRRPTH